MISFIDAMYVNMLNRWSFFRKKKKQKQNKKTSCSFKVSFKDIRGQLNMLKNFTVLRAYSFTICWCTWYSHEPNVMFCAIWLVQFKNCEKHPLRSVTFSKFVWVFSTFFWILQIAVPNWVSFTLQLWQVLPQ